MRSLLGRTGVDDAPEEQYRTGWPVADGEEERPVGDELEGVARGRRLIDDDARRRRWTLL